MFERFTPAARQVLRDATEEAKRRGDARAGTEHVLVAIGGAPLPFDRAVLGPLALDAAQLRRVVDDLDRAALSALGIDVPPADEGRLAVGEWPPRRRQPSLTESARDLFARAMAEAMQHGDRRIGVEHLLLGLTTLQAEDAAARVLAHLGVDRLQLRAALLGALRRTA